MKRIRKNITLLLLLSMIVQVIAPVTINAIGGSQDFRVEVFDTEDDWIKTVDWEFDFDSNRNQSQYTIDLGFELPEEEKGSLEVLLEEDTRLEVGSYTISTEGEMVVDINDNLEENLRAWLDSELEAEGPALIDSMDMDPT